MFQKALLCIILSKLYRKYPTIKTDYTRSEAGYVCSLEISSPINLSVVGQLKPTQTKAENSAASLAIEKLCTEEGVLSESVYQNALLIQYKACLYWTLGRLMKEGTPEVQFSTSKVGNSWACDLEVKEPLSVSLWAYGRSKRETEQKAIAQMYQQLHQMSLGGAPPTPTGPRPPTARQPPLVDRAQQSLDFSQADVYVDGERGSVDKPYKTILHTLVGNLVYKGDPQLSYFHLTQEQQHYCRLTISEQPPVSLCVVASSRLGQATAGLLAAQAAIQQLQEKGLVSAQAVHEATLSAEVPLYKKELQEVLARLTLPKFQMETTRSQGAAAAGYACHLSIGSPLDVDVDGLAPSALEAQHTAITLCRDKLKELLLKNKLSPPKDSTTAVAPNPDISRSAPGRLEPTATPETKQNTAALTDDPPADRVAPAPSTTKDYFSHEIFAKFKDVPFARVLVRNEARDVYKCLMRVTDPLPLSVIRLGSTHLEAEFRAAQALAQQLKESSSVEERWKPLLSVETSSEATSMADLFPPIWVHITQKGIKQILPELHELQAVTKEDHIKSSAKLKSLFEHKVDTLLESLKTISCPNKEVLSDRKLAKALIYSVVFRCVEPIVIVAACLAQGPALIFESDKTGAETRREIKKHFGCSDDPLVMINMYNTWNLMQDKHLFAVENSLDNETFIRVKELRERIVGALSTVSGISSQHLLDIQHPCNANKYNVGFISSIMAASFYPQLFFVTDNAAQDLSGSMVKIHPFSGHQMAKEVFKGNWLTYLNQGDSLGVNEVILTNSIATVACISGNPLSVSSCPNHEGKVKVWPQGWPHLALYTNHSTADLLGRLAPLTAQFMLECLSAENIFDLLPSVLDRHQKVLELLIKVKEAESTQPFKVHYPGAVSEPSVKLYADASRFGYGAYIASDQVLADRFGRENHHQEPELHRWRELFAVVKGVATWADLLRGRHVVLHTDNRWLDGLVGRGRGVCQQHLPLILTLLAYCSKYQIQLESRLVADNSATNALARLNLGAFKAMTSTTPPQQQQQLLPLCQPAKLHVSELESEEGGDSYR